MQYISAFFMAIGVFYTAITVFRILIKKTVLSPVDKKETNDKIKEIEKKSEELKKEDSVSLANKIIGED